MTKAIDLFQRAISYDPLNIRAYVEIIECYISLYAYDSISHENFTEKTAPIFEIVSKFDQAVEALQVTCAKLKIIRDWDFESSEQHLRKALIIDPNSLTACFRYSELLLWTGRVPETLKMLKRTIQLGSLSVANYKRVGRLFYGIGRYENAKDYLGDVLDMEPNDHEALIIFGAVAAEMGDHAHALNLLNKSLSVNNSLEALALIGYVNALTGNTDVAESAMDSIKSYPNERHQMKLAVISLALGDKDGGYKYLKNAYDSRECDLLALAYDPRFKRIRGESRYDSLAVRVGLPV